MRKIGVICKMGLEAFIPNIVNHFKKNNEVKLVYNDNVDSMKSVIDWADTVWLEWANEIAIKITNDQDIKLSGKQVICRAHGYEIYSGMINQVNWPKVTDLIFVSEQPKLAFESQVKSPPKIHVINNGIDLVKFPLQNKPKNFKIGCLGLLSSKKSLQLLLIAFRELLCKDRRFTLHIAGPWQEAQTMLYVEHMVHELKLVGRIGIDGPIKNVAKWLEDKQFIVSSSYHETQGLTICEGMATGSKPLIHNFKGSKVLYPQSFVWTTIGDFISIAREKHFDSNRYRQHIIENFNLVDKLDQIDREVLCIR